MILNTIRRIARQIGLTDGRIFDPAFNGRIGEVQRPQHLPDGQARLHLFAADFSDRAAAMAFCYGAGDTQTPEPITKELDGATIDTTHLEVVSGDIQSRLRDFLSNEDADAIMRKIQRSNTLIIITEDAFGGLPFQLHDTDTLRYLGDRIVIV